MMHYFLLDRAVQEEYQENLRFLMSDTARKLRYLMHTLRQKLQTKLAKIEVLET